MSASAKAKSRLSLQNNVLLLAPNLHLSLIQNSSVWHLPVDFNSSQINWYVYLFQNAGNFGIGR